MEEALYCFFELERIFDGFLSTGQGAWQRHGRVCTVGGRGRVVLSNR